MTTAVHTPGGLRGRGGLRMTPGRWMVLAIGVPVFLAIIGWSGFDIVAAAGQASFRVSYPVSVQDHRVTVATDGGDVTARQVQGGQGRLTGTVRYSLFRPHVSHAATAGGTSVSVDCNLVVGNCGLDARLGVPSGTAVRLNSGGGNMDIRGLGSDVTLTSDGGDVTVSGIGGTTSVSTGGGNLTASNLGHIRQISTSGGDVNGTGLSAPAVAMDTGGGNVTLVFTRPPASLDITSSGGDITVLLPRGRTAYDISATTSGGVYDASIPADPSSSHTIRVDSGGGNVSIAQAG